MGQDMVGMAHLCFTWCPLGPLKGGGLESSEGSLSPVAIDAGPRRSPLGCWLGTPQTAVVAAMLLLRCSDILGPCCPWSGRGPSQAGQAVLDTHWRSVSLPFLCRPTRPLPLLKGALTLQATIPFP